jgi:DNA invertase Pin-like site-specific DNA recombinase
MIIGYARVSTDGQTLDAQHAALVAAGAEKVFQETASGAKTDRAALTRALKTLNAGDMFLVTRLDRLARSTRDLLNLLETIEQQGASFRSLADTWADTTTPHGRLMVTVLGGLAEFERSLIMARTNEGRARAIANGKRMGRKGRLSEFQKKEALEVIAKGELSQREAARRYGVSDATISRLVAKSGITAP